MISKYIITSKKVTVNYVDFRLFGVIFMESYGWFARLEDLYAKEKEILCFCFYH